MRIPEGYRLQLQGLSLESKQQIANALGYRGGAALVSCFYNKDQRLSVQRGHESSYNNAARRLTPIYVAEELAQPAEIDWDNVEWSDAPPVPESTRDWARRVSMPGTLAPEFAPAFTRQVPRDVVLEDYDEELDGSVRGPFYTAEPFEDF